MSSKQTGIGTYDTAERRWAGVGPYYAMFPATLADRVVARYSAPGDTVLDPFAGRGTALFSAAVQERFGVGIEVNPVGWVYAQAKLHAAARNDVKERLSENLLRHARVFDCRSIDSQRARQIGEVLLLLLLPEMNRRQEASGRCGGDGYLGADVGVVNSLRPSGVNSRSA